MTRQKKDLTGQIFGKLKVVKRSNKSTTKKPKWVVECIDTQRRRVVKQCDLLSGKKVEINGQHGLSHTEEYKIWGKMKSRCYNKNNPRYLNYGGRGIKLCDRWLEFELFYEDMGKRPSSQHSIDRIDVNGDYEPSNCRWATVEQQNNNKTTTRWVEFFGKKYSLTQVAKKLGIKVSKLDYHLQKGRDINYIMYFLTSKKIKSDQSKYLIGYDPGNDGALVVLKDGKVHLKAVFPKIRNTQRMDSNAMIKMLRKFKDKDVVVVYEELHAMFRASAKSTFELGRQLGLIEGVVSALQFKAVPVKAKEWQKEIWKGTDKIMVKKKNNKKKTVDTKATSLKVCKRLFPKEDLRKNDRCTVPHDGIVDALLIAEYGRRMNY